MQKSILFTVEYDSLQSVVETNCGISELMRREDLLKGLPHPPIKHFQAIWDTGASTSSISERVVKVLGLSPVSIADNYTAAGIVQVKMYYVNMLLPNGVLLPEMFVSCCQLEDIDILIGMDVINKCDFALTHSDGKTTFSFRVPSIEKIDFNNK